VGAEATDDEVADRVRCFLEARRQGVSRVEACVTAARQGFSAEAMARRYLEIYARPQPRLRDHRVPSPNATQPELTSLQARLRTGRWHRAAFLSEAARSLARAGQPGLAWRAVRRSVTVAPRSAVRPARTYHLLATTAVVLSQALRS
jgi:hypothetical protein